MGAYDRVVVEGKRLNKRTASMYRQVKVVYAELGGTGSIVLTQGSYNTDVSASGNTHAGGGAIDLVLTHPTSSNWFKLQKAARMCMFADWDRPTLYRNGQKIWGHHNHGIAIGDRESSYAAKNQVTEYYRNGDGLVGNATDNDWKPRVLFSPPYPLRNVNLVNVRKESKKTRGWIRRLGVARVQRALNIKMGAGLKVDGKFGPATKKAYGQWERAIGGNGDGIPGKYSLILLGAGRFDVVI